MEETPDFLIFGNSQMIRYESIDSIEILPKNRNDDPRLQELTFDGSTPNYVLAITLINSGSHMQCIADEEAAVFLMQYRNRFNGPYPAEFELLIKAYSDDF